ncbi:MAG: 30S ribosomal protein S18 [Planctomycetes bacterium]|nr:30S ribosomal protein S18 [Planctomycetota bacterium]
MSDRDSTRRDGDGPPRRDSKFGKFRSRFPVKPEQPLDYKNVDYLSKFVGATGKLQSRRRSGFDGQDQRKLANAVKLSRFLGLMPYVGSIGGPDPRDLREYRERGDRERGPRRPAMEIEEDSDESTNDDSNTES